jgi:hemerythrin superfamily protein
MGDRQTVPELMEEDDVIDLLTRQHALIRDLFHEVNTAPAGKRAEPFERLVRLLAVHETAEEEIVHPYARRRIDRGDKVVDERLAEENEAKDLLTRLDEMGTDDPEFDKNFDVLRISVLDHAEAEERYEFSQLLEQTTKAERRAMAVGVKAAEAMAPTHPHPGVESMTKNLLVGPPIAIMDRVRDVIRKAMGQGG